MRNKNLESFKELYRKNREDKKKTYKGFKISYAKKNKSK